MGGRGAFSSAIILARSSLETWRVRWSRETEDGRVVTRIGVRLLGVGLGATFLGGARLDVVVSTEGTDVLPAGLLSVERGNSGTRDNIVSAKCLSPREWLVSVCWLLVVCRAVSVLVMGCTVAEDFTVAWYSGGEGGHITEGALGPAGLVACRLGGGEPSKVSTMTGHWGGGGWGWGWDWVAGGCEKGVGLGPLADPEKGRKPADCLGLYKVDEWVGAEGASGVLAGGRAHRVSCSPLRMADGSIRPASACAAAGSINSAEEIEARLRSLCSVFTSSVFFSLITTELEVWLLLMLLLLLLDCCCLCSICCFFFIS